jgi:hypothetical protein
MELPSRDRLILVTRYLLSPKWKLDRLSDILNMPRERIRQIGVDGLDQIRQNRENANTAHDRRRLGRRDMPPALVPLLRGSAKPDESGNNPIRRPAELEVAALVDAIQHASAISDPEIMTRFLREQQLAIGPTRITARRRPTAAVEAKTPLTDADDVMPLLSSIA